jgi:ribosomal protection tetracycline resistance protein
LSIKKDIRNIGIFAHVDAGKTTLTENFLYISGSIKDMGRVDEGTAHTDSMEVERKRGISVSAAAASVLWKGIQINIIDTPGHVDFSAEVERSLMVLDGAILVISAVEGVQSQTEIIWNALGEMNIPTLVFINKIDRAGSDISMVLEQIKSRITKDIVPIQIVLGEGEKQPRIIEFKEDLNDTFNESMIKNLRESMCEILAENNENILEKVVNDERISISEIEKALISSASDGKTFPVMFGAALKGLGIDSVLDAVTEYLPPPLIEGDSEPTGIAYKIHHGKYGGKAVHVRLYEGSVRVREMIYNYTRGVEEKITGIFKVNGSQFEPVEVLEAGEIGILSGLESVKIGDIFGNSRRFKKLPKIASPTLTVRVLPVRGEQLDYMMEAFRRLEEEDPLLNVKWLTLERELHVQLMGMIQMEILTGVIKSRFDLEVMFEKPSVIYKETPLEVGIGYVSMTSPYLATLEIKVEPLPKGSGIIYESNYTTDFIFPRFQNEVKETVPEVLKEGVYGWEVTDAKITLIGGRSIELATKPSDFRAVTPIALMDALKNAGTKLLEPIQEFEIRVSKEEAGTIIGDLISMRAVLEEQIIEGESYIAKGRIPVATSLNYSVRIASLSQGRGFLKTRFLGFEECPLELGTVRQRKTADPSDRERYLISISKKSIKDRAVNNARN